jgi:adenine phosphoribosyltransferase
MNLKDKIRDIADFPQKGILFRDITTLIKDPAAFKYVIDELTKRYADEKIDIVAAVESRGYVFGAPLAYNLGAGFVTIRKPGKLPCETYSQEYELEYGKNTIEIHKDAVKKGQRVLLIDDLIATGGSSKAAAKLIELEGGKIIEIAFIIELNFLNGREALKDYPVYSMIQY